MSVAALDTPPSSDVEAATNLPPSPPLSPTKSARLSLRVVDRLIGTLRLQRRGQFNAHSDWLVFKLSEAEYAQFGERLREEPGLLGWWEDKVRHDWDAQDGRLVLRMPSALHERFTASIERTIYGAIGELAQRVEENAEKGGGKQAGDDGKLAAELRRVYEGGSTTVQLKAPPKLVRLPGSSQESDSSSEHEEKVVKRSPDASYYHPSQPYHPTLVIEVSYSQRQKDLPRLVESYIIESAHAIRAVLCIKLPYLSPAAQANLQKRAECDKAASYSLWRPCFVTSDGKSTSPANEDRIDSIGACEEQVKGARFRDAAGNFLAGSLELRLTDLLPAGSEVLERISPTSEMVVRIDHRELFDALTEAEEALWPSDQKKEEMKTLAEKMEAARPKRFMKRKRSPSEELSDGREEAFLLQEMREQEKDAEADREYVETARRVRRNVTLEDGEMEVVGGASTAGHGDEDRVEAFRDVG